MPEATVNAVAITSTEWRSLLTLGELRLARRRVQEIHVPPTTRDRDRLFSWGPTTVIGDGNDVLILELIDEWAPASRRHPAQPAELAVVPLSAFWIHHAVGPEFHRYFLGEAEKEGVELLHGRYDKSWSEWVEMLQTNNDLAAARELLTALGIERDLSRKRPDGYSWTEVVRLARSGRTVVKARPKHIESILRSIRSISHSVAGVYETAAFDVAVNVEWVRARLDKDAFKKKDLRVALESAIEIGRNLAWSRNGVDCQPIEAAIALLLERFPRAYSEGLNPLAVASQIRLVMAAKDRTLDPHDVTALIAQLKSQDGLAAATVCVAIAGALGPILTRRLVRSLTSVDLLPIDWS